MKPEKLADDLHDVLGERLQSVILYGSAAAGDHVAGESDYNILVLVTELGLRELTALARPSRVWQKAGNPPPLVFTLKRLQASADVFPIELMDMRESHRVLYGEDVIDSLEVRPDNLRLILERELKTLVVQLREGFMLTDGRSRRVRDLMADSLSTVLVLFRASLRLYDSEVPAIKVEAMNALRKYIDFDTDVFLRVEAVRQGTESARGSESLALFDRYLKAVESVADTVDNHVGVREKAL